MVLKEFLHTVLQSLLELRTHKHFICTLTIIGPS